MPELEAEQIEIPAETDAPVNDVEAIDALLSGEEPIEEPIPAEKPAGDADAPGGDADDDAAATGDVGEKPDDKPTIDYTEELEIPLPGGGEKVTLGALKDAYIQNETTRRALEDSQVKMMQEQQLMAQYVAATGGEIPPEFRQQVAARHNAYLEQNHQQMLEVIPAWKDFESFKRDQPVIRGIGKDLGYSDNELNMIADYRHVHALYRIKDLQGQLDDIRAREAKAAEDAKALRKRSPEARKGRPASAAKKGNGVIEKAKQSGNMGDQVDAINQLIG